jgi:predicted MFS family arabinose efflux permease
MAQRQISLDSSHTESSSVDRYAWVILFVVFLMSVAAPLNMSKVPPLMPVLRDTFSLSLGQGGALMSVFAITGLILALPTGFIMQMLGLNTTGLVAMVCLVVGAAVGAVSPGAEVLLGSRVIEGIGMGLITVAAPAIIALWFPREKQGIPMGLWATWVPVGSVLMYNLAPAISDALGWQAVWWGGAGFALVALVLFVWLMRMPDENQAGRLVPDESGALAPPVRLGQSLANRNIWLLALSFGCFNLVFLAISTFYPTFLTDEHGFSVGQAAFITSISTMVVLVSAPFAGYLSDLIGSRKWLIVVPSLVISVMLIWPFRVVGQGPLRTRASPFTQPFRPVIEIPWMK